ncbi:enoyl-CoA hydratase/isomerase family protein [Bacillus sp. FJAT-27251]|uniref:enoyl-CoA hydratase/isomerase family protein n=1 Tax=Bacillus sp. FJAT-27251 TaxID=1684142 RepID=UPI0006A79BE4|nr:enoyl-CoA hydratase/isomerase family protein [Bacillus sp. FJAT-27251]
MGPFKHLFITLTDQNIAIVKMNSGKSSNLLHYALMLELIMAFKKLNDDEEVACIILTGDEEAFLAGPEIRELTGISVSEAYDIATKMKALQSLVVHSSKPYIAAIDGFCLGGGLELALVCDIRLAGHNAIFGLPEVNLGIIPGGGGISRLTEIAGKSTASTMIFTGEPIRAEKALELKLVSEVVEDPLESSLMLAKTLTTKSRLAIATAKKLINRKHWSANQQEDLEQELYAFSLLFDYPDSVEGMGAFLEKRKPIFKN